MLKEGRVIAEGTPDSLKAMLGGDWLDIVVRPNVELDAVMQMVKPVATGDIRTDMQMNRISIPVTDRTRAILTVATALSQAGIEPEDLTLRRPTLDAVFLHLIHPA